MSLMLADTVYVFGLCAAFAALALLFLTSLAAKKKGLPAGTASVFCAFAIPLAVLCARLLYVLANIEAFFVTYENPALMLCFWDGGLSMTGAIAGVVLGGLLAARAAKLSFARLADAFVIPLSFSLAVLYFAERFTDLGTGKSVHEGFLSENLPFLLSTQKMGKTTVFNLQPCAYEMAAFLLLSIVLMGLSRRLLKRDGDTALLFFTLAGAVTILFESMRDDGHMLIIIFVKTGQLGGAVMLLVATGILIRRYHRAGGKPKAALYAWIAQGIGLAGISLIEFALDGRLAFGAKSMGINYLAMLLCCVWMATVNRMLMKRTEVSA